MWRLLCLSAAVSLAAGAQSTYTTTTMDVNGNRVPLGPQVSSTHTDDVTVTTQSARSINGRMVPVERIEEHVLRKDASGTVVERIVQRYDDTGNPAGKRRIVVEQQNHPGGSTVESTTYATDVNGRMSVVERSTTETQVSGTTITANTVVERPTINGSFEPVEKQNVVTTKHANNYEEATVTYRKDPAGQFQAAVRRTTEHQESGGKATDNTAEYEVGPTGRLELHSQRVVNTEKGSGGSENEQVDIFRKNVPGVVNDTGALQLIEHQIIERRSTAGGIVETLSVQRPTVADPNKLGPPRELSETVCKGKCGDRP
jgi:hypothetical protein